MSVDPSFRRHGIATRLLKHLEQFALDHGQFFLNVFLVYFLLFIFVLFLLQG
jgi:GNAT superfamily N-acetyltransferase